MKRFCTLLSLVVLAIVLTTPVFGAEKEWTFMVFLNADNNLDNFGVVDKSEMAKVGSNDFLNIVSLIDRENGPATLNYIEKNNIKKIKDMGEVDMGDYHFMVQYAKDMIKAYPAKHYALIIWNHGSGWNKSKSDTVKGISYDDSTGNHITTEQLGLACQEIKGTLGKNLDILGMDACLMQMVEVAYAVKDSTDVVVGSEETEPGDGYPYDGILSALKKGMDAKAFAKIWVKAYADSYSGGSQGSSSSTQSAIDCAQITDLCAALDELAAAAIKGRFATQFKSAVSAVQNFYYSSNIDLGDLMKQLNGISDGPFAAARGKVNAALAKTIVANGHSGSDMANATGLAIYFPAFSYSFSSEYAKLAFAKNTQWDEMVQDYYKKANSAVVADAANGDISSLIEFVKTANTDNREVSSDLVTKLNFRMLTEGGLSTSLTDTLSNLVKELQNK